MHISNYEKTLKIASISLTKQSCKYKLRESRVFNSAKAFVLSFDCLETLIFREIAVSCSSR